MFQASAECPSSPLSLHLDGSIRRPHCSTAVSHYAGVEPLLQSDILQHSAAHSLHGHFLTDIIPLTSVLEIVPPGCGHLPELVEVLCLRPVPVHLRVQQVGLAVALAGAGVTSPEYEQ